MNKFLIVYETLVSASRSYTSNMIREYEGEMLTADQVNEFITSMTARTELQPAMQGLSVRVYILNIIKLG